MTIAIADATMLGSSSMSAGCYLMARTRPLWLAPGGAVTMVVAMSASAFGAPKAACWLALAALLVIALMHSVRITTAPNFSLEIHRVAGAGLMAFLLGLTLLASSGSSSTAPAMPTMAGKTSAMPGMAGTDSSMSGPVHVAAVVLGLAALLYVIFTAFVVIQVRTVARQLECASMATGLAIMALSMV